MGYIVIGLLLAAIGGGLMVLGKKLGSSEMFKGALTLLLAGLGMSLVAVGVLLSS